MGVLAGLVIGVSSLVGLVTGCPAWLRWMRRAGRKLEGL